MTQSSIPPSLNDLGSGSYWVRPPYAVDLVAAPINYETNPFVDGDGNEHKFARGIECAADTDVEVEPLGSSSLVTLTCKAGVQKGFFFKRITTISAGTIQVLF